MRYMFLPFRRYFDFSGRSRRLEFWLFLLFNLIVGALWTTVFFGMFLGQMVNLGRRYGYETQDRYSVDGYGFETSYSVNVPPEVLLAELGPIATTMMAVYLLYTCIVMIPALAVTVRRLHDTNRSGWWVVLPYGLWLVTFILIAVGMVRYELALPMWAIASLTVFAAAIAQFVLLVFMLLGGTPGPNRFGPDPKTPNLSNTFA